ncbi:3-dehydrosphinganine reductase TSC10A-like isoform X1 [Selaginella moellendorffii]|uniref:3-dehydrosphinganine reductase TSC10A-like isoform X1 n=1 Tax=Selaginella moellendorffii TaxID=88036 RepID=UPI000D1CC458|nr:3-dehydrosphinganine reductase TSC10A-like isoform X1 [Selaginella moellendorffii]|eukprot:XP_024541901.1 3-dehydrosphinganine reductase TSC10A-like isoform X1 [Selaginella moellendorffii]
MLFLVVGIILLAALCRRKTKVMESLMNKHVFVTGGSSGIGYEIAKRALIQGAFVTIVARNKARLAAAKESLLKECVCSPSQIVAEELDVGDFAATKRVIEQASRWRPIDVLVCNAGLVRSGLFGECRAEDIDQVVRTNLLGCAYSVHAALPHMKQEQNKSSHGKSIVLIGSLAGMYTLYGANIYAATKYALRGLAETLRLELLPHNIRVSLICPGFTDTALLGDATTDQQVLETLKSVCHYDPRDTESPADVAARTVEAIKAGEYIVATRRVGGVLVMLSRGLLPSESIVTTLLECVFFVPVRLLSVLVLLNVRRLLGRSSNSK